MDSFAQLTPPQLAAARHTDGPLLMLAGPGSGKTRTIVHRVVNLMQQGIPAQRILALTFTNKAAQEMNERVQDMMPGAHVWMGTFHRFCARRLRDHAAMVGLHENYSIYDTSDSKTLMKRAVEAANVSTSHMSVDQISSVISRFKNHLTLPDMLQGQRLTTKEKIAADVYPHYQQMLLTANAVDFDDLLLHFATMLRENAELRAEMDARFRYIMVDEYQDTNLAQ
ncbi:MAG: UvrD-helicase domain-containing protein, partial [Planctomycetota bacterium]